MSLRRSIVAVPLFSLAACPGPGSSGNGVINLRISATEMVGQDELWALRVGEANESNTDLNGDGDSNDVVLRVYDHASGAVVDTGLALGLPSIYVVGDVLIAFEVPEAGQGDTDLNGDGDTNDIVLHVYDHRTGVVTNTGHAVGFPPPAIGVGLVAFAVPEAAEGNQDLDGDGKTQSRVLHVYDSRTLLTTNAGREVDFTFTFHHHQFAFVTDEVFSGDLNGDGDATDSVFQLYDAVIGGVITVPLAVLGEPLATRTEDWYLLASELAQGLDLNGDGDTNDGAYQRIEPHLATIQPLGLSSQNTFGLNRSNESFAALVVQENDGFDRNGDGDLLDGLVVLYDPVNDRIFDPGLAISAANNVFLGDRLVVLVDEASQAEDLDGDGDELDRVVHVLDPLLETSTNLGVDGVDLARAGGMLVISRDEPNSANDWNGDGDQDDRVFFVWDPLTGELENTGVATQGVLSGTSDKSFLFEASEADEGRDLNGDGDTDDPVYTLYDLRARRTIRLGLAAGPFGSGYTHEGAALFLVAELAQGRDLNGDGDQDDAILHVRE